MTIQDGGVFMPGFGGEEKESGVILENIVRGWAMTRDLTSTGIYADYFTMFNKDRTKRLGGAAASPIGGTTYVGTYVIDPATLSTLSTISQINGTIGQVYKFTGNFMSYVEIAPDDDYCISSGVAGQFRRLDFNSAYQIVGGIKIIFDEQAGANRSWKKPRIIDAAHFVSVAASELQEVKVFEYDANAGTATILKTINVGFDIQAYNIVNGKLIVIGTTMQVAIIDIDTEAVIYSETATVALWDVVVAENYAFVKTTQDTTIPMLAYNVADPANIIKLNLAPKGIILTGTMISPCNIVKDDNNLADDVFLIIYHSNNGANLGMFVDVITGAVWNVDFTAGVLTGNNSVIQPSIIAGNRLLFATNFSGTPGNTQMALFRYANTLISFSIDGNGYEIKTLAAAQK